MSTLIIRTSEEYDAAVQELDQLFDQHEDKAWELERTQELFDAIEEHMKLQRISNSK